MAITTENEMRSITGLPFYTSYPVGGYSELDDFVHATWMFSSSVVPVSGTQAPTGFCFQEVTVVKLTVPGTVAGSQVFHFSMKEANPVNLALGLDVRPYLLSFGGRATRIDTDKSLTQRASISLRFADDDNAPDFKSTVFTTFKGGAFWRRLIVAQPDYIGSEIEVRRGFLPLTSFSAMTFLFRGRVEKIDPQNDGTVTLTAKDFAVFQDRLAPAKISDTNITQSAIVATAAAVPVLDVTEFSDPANLNSKNYFPTIARLQPDSIPFKLTAGIWTAATRDLTEVGAFAGYNHVEGDEIFLTHASITDGLFTVLAKVNDDSVILSEEINSGNLTTVVSIPMEDVIVRALDTGADELDVQDNHFDETEDFADAVWVKTGVTISSDFSVGPFGGQASADLLDFAAVGDKVLQDTGLGSGGGPVFSFIMWLKSPISSGTITLVMEDDTGEVQTSQFTLTGAWQRLGFKRTALSTGTIKAGIARKAGDLTQVIATKATAEPRGNSSFYAPRSGGLATDAGRGAFGTVASAHAISTPVIEVLTYAQHIDTADGVHPIVLLRDLVNRGGVASADVDQASFDAEFDFIPSMQMRKATSISVREPERLSDLIKRVRQQGLIDLWAAESGKITVRLSFRQALPGVTAKRLTAEDNLLFKTLNINNNAESRITRIFIFFDPRRHDAAEDADRYLQGHVRADLAVELLSGEKSRRIFADFLFREQDAVATAGRIIGRFKRAARIASFDLGLSDEPDFTVGDVVILNTPDILVKGAGGAAVRGDTRFQVRQRSHKRKDGRVHVEGLEVNGRRHGIISPNNSLANPSADFPDFDSATDAEKQYGFIGDSSNEVTAAGGLKEDGYYIL